MSCRIVSPDQQAQAEAPPWPEFRIKSHAAEPEEDLDGANAALAKALDQYREAQDRLAEMERSITEQEEAAYKKGYAEGNADGRKEAEEENQPVVERAAKAIADLAGLRARIRQETERDLIRLSIEIARRILRREVSVDPEALTGVVRAALDKLLPAEKVVIRIHPRQAEGVRAELKRLNAPPGLTVETDSSLEPGAMRCETGRGTLDASVERQLGEIERGFTERAR
jgi:flagellar assembly protein FliH